MSVIDVPRGIANLVDMERFSEKIKTLMRERRMSQADLAEASGMPQARVSKILAGEGRIYADQAAAWAKVFGVSLDYLADDTLDAPPPELSHEDRTILDLARVLGYQRALLRLATEPLIGPLPPPPPSPGPRS